MHFKIETNQRLGLDGRKGSGYTWRLIGATGTLCQSPDSYGSIALARGSVQQFRRSASGIRFARTESP